MTFQFSHEFHQRWLAAAVGTREQIKADLNSIVELLSADMSLSDWQKKYGMHRTISEQAEQTSLFYDDKTQSDDSSKPASSVDMPDVNILGGANILGGVNALGDVNMLDEALKAQPHGQARKPHKRHKPQSDIARMAIDAISLTAKQSDKNDQSLDAFVDDVLESAWQKYKPKLKKEVFDWLNEQRATDAK